MFEKIYSHGIDDDKEDGEKIYTFHNSKRRKKIILNVCVACGSFSVQFTFATFSSTYFFSHLLLLLLFSILLPICYSLHLSYTLPPFLPRFILHTLCFIWFYICIRIDTVCFLFCCRVLNAVAFHIVYIYTYTYYIYKSE